MLLTVALLLPLQQTILTNDRITAPQHSARTTNPLRISTESPTDQIPITTLNIFLSCN